MMMKNKQAEKCKKEIEQLRKQPQNHRCANCSQLSVPYVCLTYGTFVCTRCAGLLREINAKVKSISASTFTPQEVEKITGNELDAKNYLARWDESIYKLPGPDDKERASEFIRIKYEELRWATNEIRAQAGKEPLPDVQLPVVQPEQLIEEQQVEQPQQQPQQQEQQQQEQLPQKQQLPQRQLPQFTPQRQQLVQKKKVNPFDDIFSNNTQENNKPQEQKEAQQQVQQPVQEVKQEQKQEEQKQQADDLFADIFGASPQQPQQPAQKQETSIFDQQPKQPAIQQPTQQPAANKNALDDLLAW